MGALVLVSCAGWVPGRQGYWDAKVSEMCEKDGGTKVFEVMELPKSQYNLLLNKFGKLDIPLDQPSSDNAPLAKRERLTHIRDGNPSVWRYEVTVIRKSDQKILGTQITYARVGGDFPSPAHESSFSCPGEQVDLFSAVAKLHEDRK